MTEELSDLYDLDSSAEKHIIHIFKTGTHKDNQGREHTFTLLDLQKIASSFNEVKMKVPIVKGHPKISHPRFGDVLELFVEGNDLYAKATLSKHLQSLIKSEAYPNVSAAFWDQDADENPKKEQSMFLRHVGFLDKSTPPSVKGLKPVRLDESADANHLMFMEGTHTYSEKLHEQILYFQESTDCSYQNAFNHIINEIKARKEKQKSNIPYGKPSASEELHQEILAYQKQAGGSYTDAFHHVTKGV